MVGKITAFGRELRIIRMDRGELLKDMAESLGVTSSYLSAVEVGKRNIPDSWVEKISDLYALGDHERERLADAAVHSVTQLKLDLGDAPVSTRTLAYAFARKFRDLDEREYHEIMNVLRRKRDDAM
ncbi:MAG: helix-turn-helix domain-containing protein [Oscillospiraceae bacterium]|nr:helix-turn-helix domain-containing protein [Oscillospiraceae bacterium]